MKRKSWLTVLCILALGILCGPRAWAAGGTSSFSDTINWRFTGDLYYYVTGGPPNTCGDLHTIRNGSSLVAYGWICTDSNGSATKGPWSWDQTPSDQNDQYVTIWWPDGTQTLPFRNHIWDKSCPTTVGNPPGAYPPSSHSGSASDVAWGAGFNANWTTVKCLYRQTNSLTGEVRYWTSGSTYSNLPQVYVTGTVSGMPGFNVTWSCPVPPSGAHSSGNCYRWEAGVNDGPESQGGCRRYAVTASFCL